MKHSRQHNNPIPDEIQACLSKLCWKKFQFCVLITEPVNFSGFAGLSLRAAFQDAIMSMTVCKNANRYTNCYQCSSHSKCLYSSFLFPKFPKTFPYFRKFSEKPPQPYVIRPVFSHIPRLEKGNMMLFEIILFGNDKNRENKLIPIVNRMGENGIGLRNPSTGRRGCFQLVSVYSGLKEVDLKKQTRPDIQTVEDIAFYDGYKEFLRLHFVSPTTIKIKSQFISAGIIPEILGKHLFERVALVSSLFCEADYPDISVFELLNAGFVLKSDRLEKRHYPYTRDKFFYGITGTCDYANVPQYWLPLLFAGSVTGIGENASAGFGQYIISYAKSFTD